MADFDIAALEANVAALRAGLAAAEAVLRQARIDVGGVKPGDIVRSTRNGKLHRVVKMDTYWKKPWIIGNPERKDGSYGTAERRLFDDWEPAAVPNDTSATTRV